MFIHTHTHRMCIYVSTCEREREREREREDISMHRGCTCIYSFIRVYIHATTARWRSPAAAMRTRWLPNSSVPPSRAGHCWCRTAPSQLAVAAVAPGQPYIHTCTHIGHAHTSAKGPESAQPSPVVNAGFASAKGAASTHRSRQCLRAKNGSERELGAGGGVGVLKQSHERQAEVEGLGSRVAKSQTHAQYVKKCPWRHTDPCGWRSRHPRHTGWGFRRL
jgi:hypothetical protein